MRTPLALVLALLFAPSLLAAPPKGISFAHKDWELACDNTGACRAAGYSSGEVSVLLARKAGPHSTVNVEAVFAQRAADQPLRQKATLLINGTPKGELINQPNEYFSLSYEQRLAFITALRQDDKIEFESNGERKQLSTTGSNAVLLKMDEFQKRIGTDSALLHPGTGNSDAVLPATPAPEIITQPVIRHPEITRLTAAQLQKIAPWLQLTPEMNCHEDPDGANRVYRSIPIDKRHVLIQTACFDNSRFATWLTDSTLTARPELITHDAEEYRGEELVRFSGPIQGWVWDGKRFTLRDEYRSGGQGSMSIGGVWTLPTFVSNVRTQRDVDIDNAALQALYDAVMQEKAKNPALALHNIAARFPIARSWTDFELLYAELGDLPPAIKPSEGISDDEWQAFLRSPVTADTESGRVSYSLVDLDGDGRRDLIISSYVGGTGLFNYTGVLKRGESTFYVVNKDAYEDEFGVAGALFSENGRGANQWSQWVEINGQVYALWFNGRFGEDNLYLLRPFSAAAKTPAVTVRYRYDYDMDSVEPREEGQPLIPKLNNKDKARLVRSLNIMQRVPLKGHQADSSPICPIPPGTPPEDADRYRLGSAGTYMSEPIANIPVWVSKECFIGSVESYFGQSEFITVASPKEQAVVGEYAVTGIRHVVSIKSSWKIREGDNGVL